jgi:hypothetical protein
VTRFGELSPVGRLFTLKITEVAHVVLGTFSHGKTDALILPKKWLGYIMGDFSTNSSGHPAHRVVRPI